LSALDQWATQIMTAASLGSLLALLSLILIAAVMEIGLPIPFVIDSSLLFVSLYAGFISFPTLLVVLALFGGRFIGSSILYWIGRLFSDGFTKWLKKRWPKVSDRILYLSDKLSQPAPPVVAGNKLTPRLLPRYSSTFRVPLTIVMIRFTPGLLTVSSVAAGGISMRYGAFVLGIGLSSIIADGLVLIVGFLASFGLKIMGVTPSVWQLVIGLTILISLGWGIFFLVKRRRQKPI
jgi:membrane protein DedA with SNARE-associated domain